MPKRWLYFGGFAAVVLLLTISLYLQFFLGLNPCPLCTLQRLVFILIGSTFALGWLFYRFSFFRRCLYCLLLPFCGLGIFLASRQIYIQHFPPADTGECVANLAYLLHILPANEVFKKIIHGSIDCSEHGWQFLSLNIAEWSLLWFVLFLILTLLLLRKEINQ